MLRNFEATKDEMAPAQQVLILAMLGQLSVTEQMLDELKSLRTDVKRQGWR